MKRLTVIITDKTSNQRDILNLGTDLSVEDISDAVIEVVENGGAQANVCDDLKEVLEGTGETFWVRTDQDSSFVEAIGYNFATEQLTVELTSGVYNYQGVPVDTFIHFVNSGSKGVYFNRQIKGRF